MAITNTFSPNTTIRSAAVNTNFTDLAGKIVYMNIGDGTLSSTNAAYGSETNNEEFMFYFTETANIVSIKYYCRIFLFVDTGDTAYSRIYNTTDAAAVAGSEVTVAGVTADTNWEISGELAGNFNATEKQYRMECKSDGSDQTRAGASYLKITYK